MSIQNPWRCCYGFDDFVKRYEESEVDIMKVYQDDPRNPSMSSETLLKRGTCCRSACLHCPYGHTIKVNRFEFLDISPQNRKLYEDLSRQLTMSADSDQFSVDDYKMISLKGYIFGLIRVDKLFVREIEILPSFQKQGITKELIESYYFY